MSDAKDDEAHGDLRGDEMADWVANTVEHLARIREAKAALEAEAKAQPPDDDDEGPGPSSGMGQKGGRPHRGPDGGPPDRAQRNFTDPDSRIQPTRKGFIAGYNAQIAVDAGRQSSRTHCRPILLTVAR